jgi:hypothetical protein
MDHLDLPLCCSASFSDISRISRTNLAPIWKEKIVVVLWAEVASHAPSRCYRLIIKALELGDWVPRAVNS